MGWLKEIRKREGLTQVKLAAKAGVSQQTIAAIESGYRLPGRDTAKAIAAALNFKRYGLEWTAFYDD